MSEPRSWTRATTVAETLSDRFGLEKWNQRNIILGLGARPDLYALAQASTPDEKSTLNDVAKESLVAAKSRASAHIGSALHRWLERIDRDEEVDIPSGWRPDIDAYCQALVDARVTIDPNWIERVVVIPKWGIAGTLDRLVKVWEQSDHLVADFKSGAGAVTYDVQKIAAQLAIYAHATHAWKGTDKEVPRDRWKRYLLFDPEDKPEEYELLPSVSQDRALVIHMIPKSADCRLYEIDIKAGAEAVELALDVRAWRKRDDLLTPLTQPKEEPANPPDDDW